MWYNGTHLNSDGSKVVITPSSLVAHCKGACNVVIVVQDGKYGKVCPACKQWKQVAYFYSVMQSSDGFGAYCRECAIAKRKEYRARQMALEGKTVTPRMQQPEDPELKRCTRCKKVFPRTRENFYRNTLSVDGLASVCQYCMRDHARIRRINQNDRVNGLQRKSLLKSKLVKYGADLDTYFADLAAQGGQCAICRREPEKGRRLSVDHDHNTGAYRGLLCRTCNTMLGMARDDPDTLRAAIEYLEASREVSGK